MANFTEQRIISQVTILPAQCCVNVQWVNQVLKDGEVVSSSFERKAYGQGQAAEFAAEVEGAAAYMTAMGWTL